MDKINNQNLSDEEFRFLATNKTYIALLMAEKFISKDEDLQCFSSGIEELIENQKMLVLKLIKEALFNFYIEAEKLNKEKDK